MLIVTRQTAEHSRSWGLGGTLPPTAREALDWLTFGRLMGWEVSIAEPSAEGIRSGFSSSAPQIIVGCDPEALDEAAVGVLAATVEKHCVLAVTRAARATAPMARLSVPGSSGRATAGTTLEWVGPGPRVSWRLRSPVSATAIDVGGDGQVWATLDGAPVVGARRLGRSQIVTLGGHPSVWRDVDGAATAFLRHLLVRGSPRPVAWLDMEGTVVLRMDDPGGAQNVHFQKWNYRKLNQREWSEIACQLTEHSARLSIGYTPGWVDDGDVNRGRLEVAGCAVQRIPGAVHPSPLVRYVDLAGHAPGMVHDYQAEFRGIQALRAAGLGEVELHGYTHMFPDTEVWAAATDRYVTKGWFRELGWNAAAAIRARSVNDHPLGLGMEALRQHFGLRPTTVICPGHECDEGVIERALDEGLMFVSHGVLAIRDGHRWCWTTNIGAPELDEVDAAWLATGFPVVVFFHDRDLVLKGTSRLGYYLERWRDAGANRFVDFRQLASEIGRHLEVDEHDGQIRIIIHSRNAPPLVAPLHIRLCAGSRPLPAQLVVIHEDEEMLVSVHPVAADIGRVTLGLDASTMRTQLAPSASTSVRPENPGQLIT